MVEKTFIEPQIDKTVFSVTSLVESDEKEFWLSQTPQARLKHMEALRRINYGNRTSQRLQRVFEVAQLEKR